MSTKKSLTIFFSIIILYDMIMYICGVKYKFILGEEVAALMSMSPAFSVVVIKYLSKDKLYFQHYVIVVTTILVNILLVIKLFFINFDLISGIIYVIVLVSIPTFIFSIFLGKNEFKVFKNIKKIILPSALVIVLYCIFAYIVNIKILDIVIVVSSSFIVLIMYNIVIMGEEYGWRGYLQPLLQNKFGKKRGVVILALIWETWHIPYWYSYINVDFIGNILRYIFVLAISIFLGYIFMKTKNIWVCVFFHLFNNSLLGGTSVATNFNANHISKFMFLAMIVFSICLSLFIFSKEYKE